MRIDRFKKSNKNLKFFCNNFGFRKPFQVLIDGTFCFAALRNKFKIRENIKNYIDAEVKLLTTKCIIMETEALSKHLQGALVIVKQFGVHRCGHDNKPVTGSDCFQSMIADGNPNRYIIATQDMDLKNAARSMPGTPVISFYEKALKLEEPSRQSIRAAQEKSTERFNVNRTEETKICHLKKEAGIEIEQKVTQKKKKTRGANPLSCLKSKKKKEDSNAGPKNDNVNKKRKRHRVRIPEHVKAELLKKQSN